MPKAFKNCGSLESHAFHRRNAQCVRLPASPHAAGRSFAESLHTPGRSLMPAIEPGTMAEYRAKELLKSFGIPFPEGGMARNLDEAQALARSLGFPVVLKAQAAKLAHKTEAGGVILGIENDSSLAEGWAKLHNNLKVNRPGLVLDGVLVERMGQRGTELIVGLRNDPDWGPVLLAGFGGVLAEALRDVRLMPADLPIEEIVKELGALRCATLFHGFRGSPPLERRGRGRDSLRSRRGGALLRQH